LTTLVANNSEQNPEKQDIRRNGFWMAWNPDGEVEGNADGR
jgi:hypothetical protein